MKQIPYQITVNTGEQERISSTIDDFFLETRDFILKSYEVRESELQIKSGELAYAPSGPITDDRIKYLSCRDMVLAAVFETRTEFNHIRYTFFRNLDGFGESAHKR